MEADGAGMKRAASNDGKFGEWDRTAMVEGGNLRKKLMERKKRRVYEVREKEISWGCEDWESNEW
jgi:hypothetical protein